MTTRETVQRYFDALKQKKGWETFLADDIAFTSHTSPVKQLNGRDTYLQATKRFYSMIANVSVRDLIVEGDKACALTRYELQPPTGAPAFESDVAEIFSVSNGKIDSLAIYFDTAPFPK
jgi:ketosteroid isomerase-like protein